MKLPQPYLAIRHLGEGGEGEAWLAFDPLLERSVVCKRLKKASPEAADSFLSPGNLRALQTSTRLRGDGVPLLYAAMEMSGDLWVISEYIDGVALAELKTESSRLGVGGAVAVLLDVATALEALHDAQVVHGDISPANIIVDDRGVTRLIDLGLCRQVGERGTLAGVPGFTAPEMSQDHPVSYAIDAYALGALAFWLLTGEVPRQLRDATGTPLCLPPPKPTLPGEGIEGLWRTAMLLTHPDASRRQTIADAIHSLRIERDQLPGGSRETLSALVTAQGDGAASGFDPSASASIDSQQRLPTGRPRPGWVLGGVACVLVSVLIGRMIWVDTRVPDAGGTVTTLVREIRATPSTPLPDQFGQAWLRQRMPQALSPADDRDHVLALEIGCGPRFCQVKMEHQVSGGSHWHQQSLIATDSQGVWEGVIRDLVVAASAY